MPAFDLNNKRRGLHGFPVGFGKWSRMRHIVQDLDVGLYLKHNLWQDSIRPLEHRQDLGSDKHRGPSDLHNLDATGVGIRLDALSIGP